MSNKKQRRQFVASAKQNDAPKGHVTLGIPSGTATESHFTRTLTEMVMWDREYGRRHIHPRTPWTWVIGATMVTNARNTIVTKFLEQPADDAAEWLLFMDDDQLYPQHTLEYLIEAADPVERRIVGLPVWRFASDAQGPVRVTHNVMDLHEESGSFIEWAEPFPENTVMQVAAIGTGCMLIHRSALLEMQAASVEAGLGSHWCWFRQVTYQPADICEGEDLYFCRLAWRTGIPVWMNTAVTLQHVKRIVLSGAVPEGVLTT
jgi:hypothetical protein